MSVPLEIDKLVYGGQGLARWNGKVVLTPFVLPGEKVLVEIEKESAGFVTARLREVQSAAEARVAPPCPYYRRCGGCHYQHIAYQRQLELKREILLETLARLGKITWQNPVEMIADEPWGYRNRVQLRLRKQGPRFAIGYLRHGSRDLEPVESCPISSPAVNSVIQTLSRMGRDPRFPEFVREIELFTNESDVQLNVLETARPLARRFFDWAAEEIEGFCRGDSIDYQAGGDIFRVSSRSFFQVNRFLAARLAEAAIGEEQGETALDLYAGVGLFTLPLARRFSQVSAVDSNRSALRDLEHNVRRAGVSVALHQSLADAYLEGFSGPIDFLLADPPRAGLGRSVTASMARLRPRRVAIVSCDPATLARDLRALVGAGFEIRGIKMVDLFPQTFHIESVVTLTGP